MNYPVLDAVATGARIKELRKQKHLKVEEISRFMGFESDQAVYKWQRGDSLPTVDNLFALSRLLETTVDEILRGREEESESSLLPRLRTYTSGLFDYCPSGFSMITGGDNHVCVRMLIESDRT